MKKNKDLEYYQNECQRLRSELNYKFQIDPVTASAAAREDQRLYRKVGKKFVPVNDPYAYDGLREGFWLIHIKEYEEEGGDSYGFTGFEKGELVFVPDYLQDLNAIHEAEENIRHDHDSWGKYLVFLSRSAPECRVFSTAAERAEAFLRTVGKWEEEA